MYRFVFKYPFIQDDWALLHSVINNDTSGLLKELFIPIGKFFYRPLGQLYFLLIYKLFGLNSIGFHSLALLIHFVNSLLLVHILQRIINDELICWVAGLLYATSVNIHMEPLLWAVGVYDLGGMFFFLLSFSLLQKDRVKLSALTYLLALLMKESSLFLSAVFLFYLLYKEKRIASLTDSLKTSVSKLWPYSIVLVIYIVLKMQGISPFTLPDAHPYKVAFVGLHLIKNIILYGKWSLTAIFPWKGLAIGSAEQALWLKEHPSIILLIGLVFMSMLCLLSVFALIRLRREGVGVIFARFKLLVFFMVWFLLGLAPVVFLVNLHYQYYLTYSLPPLIVLFLLGLRAGALRLRCSRPQVAMVVVALAVVSVVSSSSCLYRADLEGINQQFSVGMGTNLLIKRGATTKIVMDGLLKAYPVLPRNATLVFAGIDIWSFNRDFGPRVWYGDSTIQVYDIEYLKVEPDGIYIENSPKDVVEFFTGPKSSSKICLDPESTHIFGLVDGVLREYTLSNLYEMKGDYFGNGYESSVE